MNEAIADTPSAANPVIPRQAWLALMVTVIVTFLVVIDISAVNVAFPSIQRDLGTDRATLGWMISAYNVTVAALLLPSGRFADSIGRRRVFIPGVGLFITGSLLCGLAPDVWFLVAARVIQGAGGAVVLATSFAVMLPEFPPSRRSTAIGFAGATGALGAVVGPALGSLFIELFSWRAIFLINVPIGILVIGLAPRYLRESSDPAATGKIDAIGVAAGTVGVGAIMFGIVESEKWGLADWRVWALVIVGAALLALLVSRSRNHAEPVLDLTLFSYRSFLATCVGVVLYSFAFTSGALASSLVLQELWDQPLSIVGLAFIPGPLLAAVVSPLTGSVADRFGHRWVLGVGCLLCAAGYGSFLFLLSEEPTVWSRFVPLSLVAHVGVGLTVATWASAGLSDIPGAKFGVGGATINTVRQVAYALGISVTITLLATGSGTGDLAPYRLAWGWMTGCFVLAAVAVVALFPAGNSEDRLAV